MSPSTEVLAVDEPGAFERALTEIEQGGMVAVPTDTVYGLVCRYDDDDAIERIFQLKERDLVKPLPVLLADVSQIGLVSDAPLTPLATLLAERFWPGPLTLILAAAPHLPARLIAGGETVGIRIPDDDFLRALARAAGPLASSSANHSGDKSASNAAAVLEEFDGKIPLIINGGESPHGLASTVLDLVSEPPRILRPGPIDTAVRSLLFEP